MIEEQKINNEAEDIFADVDDSAPITTLATDSGQVLPPVIMDQYPTHRRMIWLGAIVVVLIIAGAGYYGYKTWFAKPNFVVAPEANQVNEVVPNNQVVDKVEQVVATTTDSQDPQPVVSAQVVTDNDRDGLTDEEEVVLGTNINEPDSDGDGLYDREEVKVYKTNPLNPDSDGDGFTDGQEVKGGYNPNGTGKLFEFNIQK
jgi:hypothetical protein